MAKKETKKKGIKETLLNMIGDNFIASLKENAMHLIHEATYRIKMAIVDAAKTVAKLAVAGILIAVGLIMLVLSLVFLTAQWWELTFGESLLLWSLALIAFGTIYAYVVVSNAKKR